MLRISYKPMLALLWLALITSALNYWRVWNRLPTRMAVHFAANFQPNGYASRERAAELGLGIMTVVLLVFTMIGLIVHWANAPASWLMLVFFYVVTGIVWYGNYSVIRFNLNRMAHPPPVTITIHQ